MKKMKKRFLIGTSVVSATLMFFSGCNFAHYVPKEFGAWENHYMYRGNVRSKTTGEDWEYLVEEVRTETDTYLVDGCEDYAFLGDDVYLCLRLDNQGTTEYDPVNSIIQYNVKDKTQENLVIHTSAVSDTVDGQLGTWTYEPYSIERIFADRLIAYGRRAFTVEGEPTDLQSDFVYYTLDLQGEFVGVEAFSPHDYTKVSEDYFIKRETIENGFQRLYYITWGMTEGEYLDTLEPDTKTEFFEIGEEKGFILTRDYVQENKGETLACVDVNYVKINGIGRSIIYNGAKSGFRWVDEEREYYLTSEEEEITYTYKEDFFSTPIEQKQRVSTHYTLCQVNYEYNNSTKVQHTFPETQSIDIFGRKDGTFYFTATWYENARGCSGGGAQTASYLLVPEGDGKGYKEERAPLVDALDYAYFQEYNARLNGEECGIYTYYLKKQAYGISINDYQNYAYLLQRYDGEKTETMQIWSTSLSQPEEAKFCEQMWKYNGGDIHDFIVRNY